MKRDVKNDIIKQIQRDKIILEKENKRLRKHIKKLENIIESFIARYWRFNKCATRTTK